RRCYLNSETLVTKFLFAICGKLADERFGAIWEQPRNAPMSRQIFLFRISRLEGVSEGEPDWQYPKREYSWALSKSNPQFFPQIQPIAALKQTSVRATNASIRESNSSESLPRLGAGAFSCNRQCHAINGPPRVLAPEQVHPGWPLRSVRARLRPIWR